MGIAIFALIFSIICLIVNILILVLPINIPDDRKWAEKHRLK